MERILRRIIRKVRSLRHQKPDEMLEIASDKIISLSHQFRHLINPILEPTEAKRFMEDGEGFIGENDGELRTRLKRKLRAMTG
ncbi:MAG: hypothetical protein ACTSWP_10275 [Candidatus Freyarchaeota archaeon]|nr:hypothetical protein [Candidatus Freyrarchaeum guaymaensis]